MNKTGKKLFITGTGTDIGKTYVTGLIVKKLCEAGKSAAYYKAAMSGNERNEEGRLIPGDALMVKNMSHTEQPLEEMCHYVYENAYSPHLASQIEGNPVEMSVVMDGLDQVCNKYEYVTAEGSGGILCPLRHDEDKKLQLEDFVREGDFTSLIIADAGLGTINSVVLTVDYMRMHNLPIAGIIFNNYEKGNVLHEDNLKMCEEMTAIKVIAKVGKGDRELNIPIEELELLYK